MILKVTITNPDNSVHELSVDTAKPVKAVQQLYTYFASTNYAEELTKETQKVADALAAHLLKVETAKESTPATLPTPSIPALTVVVGKPVPPFSPANPAHPVTNTAKVIKEVK